MNRKKGIYKRCMVITILVSVLSFITSGFSPLNAQQDWIRWINDETGRAEIKGTSLWLGVFNSLQDALKASKTIRNPFTGKFYDYVFATSPDGNKLWDVGRAPLSFLGVDVSNPELPTDIFIPDLHVHSQAVDVVFNKLKNGELDVGKLHCFEPPGGNSIGWYSKNYDAIAKVDELNVYLNEGDPIALLPNVEIMEPPKGTHAVAIGVEIPWGKGYFPKTTEYHFHPNPNPKGKNRVVERKGHVTIEHYYNSPGKGHLLIEGCFRNVETFLGPPPEWYAFEDQPEGKIQAEIDAISCFCKNWQNGHNYIEKPIVMVKGSGKWADKLKEQMEKLGFNAVLQDQWDIRYGSLDVIVGVRPAKSSGFDISGKSFTQEPGGVIGYMRGEEKEDTIGEVKREGDEARKAIKKAKKRALTSDY